LEMRFHRVIALPALGLVDTHTDACISTIAQLYLLIWT